MEPSFGRLFSKRNPSVVRLKYLQQIISRTVFMAYCFLFLEMVVDTDDVERTNVCIAFSVPGAGHVCHRDVGSLMNISFLFVIFAALRCEISALMFFFAFFQHSRTVWTRHLVRCKDTPNGPVLFGV